MSKEIEKMITLCKECIEDWVDPDCAKDVELMKQIIAALRAGEDMYQSAWGQGDEAEAYDMAHNRFADAIDRPRCFQERINEEEGYVRRRLK